MPRFKTTVDSKTKVLSTEGDILDEDYDYETPSRSRMLVSTRDPYHIEFNLSLETFYQIQPGWGLLFHSGYEHKTLEIAFDYFEVIKFCHDPREVSKGSILTAELLDDGTGMVVKEPLIPTYFIKNIEELSEKGTDKGGWGLTRKRDYNKKMKAFNALPKQYRTTTIHFPRGIIGTNEYIGFKKKSERKNIELRVFSNIFEFWHTLTANEQLYPMYYAFWKIGVKGTNDDLNIKVQKDEAVDDACSGFDLLSMNKRNPNAFVYESDDDGMEGVETPSSQKLEAAKLLEKETELLQKELEKKFRKLKEFEAENNALKLKIENDSANLKNEAERVRLELAGKKWALENKLKEETDDLTLKHYEMMHNMQGQQEVEKKRLMIDLQAAQETEIKRLRNELQAVHNADIQKLKDDLEKKAHLLNAKQLPTKDDHLPQVGIIRNRKPNSPSTKLTVTKSSVSTRSLSKLPKTIVKPIPKAKSNVLSKTKPMEQDYSPKTDDDGLHFIWNGDTETKAMKSVALNGLKLVSDTAAQYVSDTALHYIPDFLYPDKAKKSQVDEGIKEQKVIGDSSFFDDEYDDKEFDTIALNN